VNTAAAINAYSTVSAESRVMGADPHQLIALLYEGALLAIARAGEEMRAKQTEAKGHSISKAIAIIGEGLNASLNAKAGGKLAEDLSALYCYMVKRLVDANVNNDVSALDEVSNLLQELKDAWDTIRPQVVAIAGNNSGSMTRS
jgi:flagellar secretion chaperone FliS